MNVHGLIQSLCKSLNVCVIHITRDVGIQPFPKLGNNGGQCGSTNKPPE
jgi:hypothetical protein